VGQGREYGASPGMGASATQRIRAREESVAGESQDSPVVRSASPGGQAQGPGQHRQRGRGESGSPGSAAWARAGMASLPLPADPAGPVSCPCTCLWTAPWPASDATSPRADPCPPTIPCPGPCRGMERERTTTNPVMTGARRRGREGARKGGTLRRTGRATTGTIQSRSPSKMWGSVRSDNSRGKGPPRPAQVPTLGGNDFGPGRGATS